MLKYADTLLAIASLAGAFAGFAALVSVFGGRSAVGQTLHDLLRLRLVTTISVLVIAAALVPVAVANFPIEPNLGWRLCAVAFLLLTAGLVRSFATSYRPVHGHFPPDRIAVAVAAMLEFVILGALLAVISGHWPQLDYALYIAALICAIGQAAFVFMRLLDSAFDMRELSAASEEARQARREAEREGEDG